MTKTNCLSLGCVVGLIGIGAAWNPFFRQHPKLSHSAEFRTHEDGPTRHQTINLDLKKASDAPGPAQPDGVVLVDARERLAQDRALISAKRAELIQLYKLLYQKNPELGGELGQALITILTSLSDYRGAVQFSLDDSSPNRLAWLSSAFESWGAHSPDEGLVMLGMISDPATRKAALEGLACGWASYNSEDLAGKIKIFSAANDRATVIGQLIPIWMKENPSAALEWVSSSEPSPEMDLGIAAVSSAPSLVNKDPRTAVDLATTIVDPILRANSLWMLAQSWGKSAPAALRTYLEENPSIEAADRAALSSAFDPNLPL